LEREDVWSVIMTGWIGERGGFCIGWFLRDGYEHEAQRLCFPMRYVGEGI
jgi:hypothetical protein